jgi:preprotein translocase subunit SecF
MDFIGRRKIWFAVSGAFLLISGIALATGQTEATRCGSVWPLKGLSCGIEFLGGVQVQAPIPEDGPLGDADDTEVLGEVRSALADFGAEEGQLQVAGEGADRSILVQTKEIADPEEQRAFTTAVAETVGASVAETDIQTIGSKWGSEITSKALRALVIFLIVILLFISWRFEFKMAIAAVIALIHDLAITAGIYSLVNFDVTPSTVIAILTILGYSLYDTVVVFDKVEEKTAALAATGKTTYQGAANAAMNEVFMRSINTSLTTLLPVAALLFVGAGLLGASTLKDLALALLVGIAAGTYSSIFVATPVLSIMKEHEPKYQGVRDKIERDARRAAAKASAGTPGAPATTEAAGEGETAEGVSAGPGGERHPPTTAVSRQRTGTKKAKRRRRR